MRNARLFRRVVSVFALTALLGACAPVDDEAATGNTSEDLTVAGVTSSLIPPGTSTSEYTAVSTRQLTLQPGVTATPVSGSTTTYLLNNGGGTSTTIECRCAGGCSSGACLASIDATVATCSGSCSGISSDGTICAGCSWHINLPRTGVFSGYAARVR